MSLPQKAKQWILSIDSVSYRGEIDEFTPPKISKKLEEFQAGDMLGAAKIDVGSYEAFEGSFKAKGFASNILPKVVASLVSGTAIRFTCAAQRDDSDTIDQIEWYFKGRIAEADQGSITAGELNETSFTFNATYVRYTVNGVVKFEIDIINLIEVANNVDLMAQIRAVLGLSSLL